MRLRFAGILACSGTWKPCSVPNTSPGCRSVPALVLQPGSCSALSVNQRKSGLASGQPRGERPQSALHLAALRG